MSWEAERMKDDAMRWAYESVVCSKHGVRHLNDQPCPICEDGEEFHGWGTENWSPEAPEPDSR